MELSEIIKVVSALVSAVIAICGVIGGVFWLVRRSARKLDRSESRARRLERERDEAVQERMIAENERDQAREQREAEMTERRRAAEIAQSNYNAWRKATEIGLNNYNACVKEDQKRQQAEQRAQVAEARAAELEASLTAATRTLEEQRTSLSCYETRLESVTECGGRVWQVPVAGKLPEFVPLGKRQTRIISVVNLKGGVGKTTITANLGGYLAKYLKKWVLLIDLDHQRSLTQLLQSTDQRTAAAIARRTVQDFFLSARSGSSLRAVAQQLLGLERCSIIGNSDAEQGYGTRQNLDDLEMEFLCKWLVDPTCDDVRFLMRPALHSEEVSGSSKGFDYVLIDCPPRLTTACINALAASDFVLIPAQAEPMSARSVPHLLRRLRELHDARVLPDLGVLGVVANRVSAKVEDSSSKEAKVLLGIEGLALKAWGRPVNLFKTKLRDSEFYASAPRKMEEANKLSFAVDVEAIREQYAMLLKEIEEVIEDRINENLGVTGVLA